MTARIGHHAEIKAALKTKSEEIRARFNKENEFFKRAQKTAVVSLEK